MTTSRIVARFAFACLLAGCAQHSLHRQGLDLVDAGQPEAGLAKLAEASSLQPSNRELRQAYFRTREVILQRWLAEAETARLKSDWDAAESAFRKMLAVDADNARARNGLQAVQQARRHRSLLAEAEEALKKGNAAAAEARVRAVLGENPAQREAQQLSRRLEERSIRAVSAGPQLSAALKEPITLEFTDAPMRRVFEAISKTTGLNFIFDRDVRPDVRTTLFVRDASMEDVLRFILVTNQLERKVLSENTLLVYPNTPAKLRDYQELVVKTFYLTNGDAKSIATLIRSLVKTKDLHVDDKLNLIVIRDTPDAVRMAERLVAAHDLAEAEVMLEVEVLEVGSSNLTDLGVRYPNALSFSLVGAGGTAGSFTLREWQNRSSDIVRVSVSDPVLGVNFRNELGRTNLLANPRIRVKNKEKARVHIGDKVPVITTTTTATGFATESVTYLDVGLKLEVEPLISLDDEVGIRVGLEVSNIAREIRGASGAITYQVGTRNAATTLRLRDGETQILAGLISDEDRKSVSQIPGLGDLPVLGRLFGSHLDTANKTEIVLLITPRVLRNLARPDAGTAEFLSGTEAAVGVPPLVLQTASLATAVASSKPAAASGRIVRLALQAPANIQAGEEFELLVMVDTTQPLRSGLLDIAFDPSRLRFARAQPGTLLAAADKAATLKAAAPEAMGRLELGFQSGADIAGRGELIHLTFQALGTAAGAPVVRIEAMSLTDAGGTVVNAPLPPPLRLSLTR